MYIIDGSKFRSKKGFYNFIENLLTEALSWKIGRNLNAFNDVLRGGFGKHEYEEKISITWINFAKSTEYLNSNFLNSVVEIINGHEHIDFEKFDFHKLN